MIVINSKKSDKYLKQEIGEIENCQQAVNKFLLFFETHKIKALEHEEEDMMLFEYGVYDWWDGKGAQFNFSLTRQFEILGEDEFLQLKLTLFYDPERFTQLKAYNSWSTSAGNIQEWKQKIEETEGYLQSANLLPKKVIITLNQT